QDDPSAVQRDQAARIGIDTPEATELGLRGELLQAILEHERHASLSSEKCQSQHVRVLGTGTWLCWNQSHIDKEGDTSVYVQRFRHSPWPIESKQCPSRRSWTMPISSVDLSASGSSWRSIGGPCWAAFCSPSWP